MDLDGDGHLDILSGSYSRLENDMAGLFQLLRGQADGTFRPAEVVKGTDGQPLIIPNHGQMTENICTRPFAVDWDGDGRLDLIVGVFSGSLYRFKGEGPGKFAPVPEPLKAGNQALRVAGYHADPFVVDWDGDGDLDILSGSAQGGVQWAENRAGKGKTPELVAFREILPIGPELDDGQTLDETDARGLAHDTRVWADDVNGDGKLDLLVGDHATLIAPVPGISKEQFAKRFAEWKKARDAALSALRSAQNQEAATEAGKKYAEVYRSRSEFLHEESTGFVWLYLRK